jgi:orotidine-5'-phosphate decarboxylase
LEVTVVLDPRDRLIVALDLASPRAAETMVETLGDSVTFYKVGYQLAFAGGLSLANTLIGAGKRVFLDMKLHDIENTVAKGVESVARLGVTFLTVHAFPQTMKAAVAARQGSALKVLAVTVLTSYDDIDLAEAGYSTSVDALVARRAQQAHDLGVDGLVCSAEEANPLRLVVGHDMLFVTPGIRPQGAAHGDQKRVTTPATAIKAGADYLVVGRPITAASDPKACVEAIVAEMTQAAK